MPNDHFKLYVLAEMKYIKEKNKILEKIGGGGSTHNGAAKFEKTTISKVEQLLKNTIKEMGE